METVTGFDGLGGAGLGEGYWDSPVHPPCLREELAFGYPSADAPGTSTEGFKAGKVRPPLLRSPRLHILAQHEGRGRVVQGMWGAVLCAGDVALYVEEDAAPDPEQPHGQVLMNFPLLGLSAQQQEVIRLLPVVLPGAHPGTNLLLQVAGSLHQAAEVLPPSLAPHFLGGLLSMLVGTMESQSPCAQLPRLTRFHLHRIMSYLREHLRDPELSVKHVAKALGMSISHVHRLFAFEGCTVSEWLWGERLEGCAADLSSASEAHRTVGDIALSWGFNDLSHFSHAFKKRFGAPPRDWRKQAAWRKPLGSSVLSE